MKHTHVKKSPKAPYYGWYIVASGWIMLFMANAVSISIFFKPILEEFGWNRATLSLIHTSALLLLAAIVPFLGRFIDRFGPRLMIFICVPPSPSQSYQRPRPKYGCPVLWTPVI
jgi:MFS family permease